MTAARSLILKADCEPCDGLANEPIRHSEKLKIADDL